MADLPNAYAAPPNPQLQAALKAALEPGEPVRWQGGEINPPKAGRWGMVLFALVWTGFALLWTGGAYLFTHVLPDTPPEGVFTWFPLFGVPFVLIGLFLFWQGLRNAPQQTPATLFAVTDRRVLLVASSGPPQAYPAARLWLPGADRRADGSGTLTIKLKPADGGPWRGEEVTIGPVADLDALERAARRLIPVAG